MSDRTDLVVDGPDAGAPVGGRRLVAVALALLILAGGIGFEAWPLTAWRLFSLARGEQQTAWVVHATTAAGEERPVSFEELPLRYRHAAWPIAELPRAGEARRKAVCQALLEPTREVVPDLVALHLVRDRQRLVHEAGEWVVIHDPEVLHTCESCGPRSRSCWRRSGCAGTSASPAATTAGRCEPPG